MPSILARTLLHTGHLATFLVLLVSGLLLWSPSLRAAVTGGYSLVIRDSHRWGGVAFVVLPALILLRYGVRNVFVTPTQRTLRSLWQGIHLGFTVIMSVVFALTGFLLWGKGLFPERAVDASLAAHDWLTYAAIAFVAFHLFEVSAAALIARLQAAAAPVAE